MHSICPSSGFSTLCVHRAHILFKINLNFELGNIYFILKVAAIYRFYVLSSDELLDYFPYSLVTILKYPKRVSLLYREVCDFTSASLKRKNIISWYFECERENTIVRRIYTYWYMMETICAFAIIATELRWYHVLDKVSLFFIFLKTWGN